MSTLRHSPAPRSFEPTPRFRQGAFLCVGAGPEPPLTAFDRAMSNLVFVPTQPEHPSSDSSTSRKSLPPCEDGSIQLHAHHLRWSGPAPTGVECRPDKRGCRLPANPQERTVSSDPAQRIHALVNVARMRPTEQPLQRGPASRHGRATHFPITNGPGIEAHPWPIAVEEFISLRVKTSSHKAFRDYQQKDATEESPQPCRHLVPHFHRNHSQYKP